eukprot:scaffold6164_cov89-Skeletonema_dohrnii-CCMP3373.AAC.9
MIQFNSAGLGILLCALQEDEKNFFGIRSLDADYQASLKLICPVSFNITLRASISHIFYIQPDAALNGLLNDAVTPTEYSDYYYNTLANSLWLGYIQINGGGAWEGHIKIQHISTGHTDPNRTHYF